VLGRQQSYIGALAHVVGSELFSQNFLKKIIFKKSEKLPTKKELLFHIFIFLKFVLKNIVFNQKSQVRPV
jgi:hypothetical protein